MLQHLFLVPAVQVVLRHNSIRNDLYIFSNVADSRCEPLSGND